MSTVEAVAVLLGIANVTLAVRRSVWNFPVAILSVLLFAWLVFQQRLYSDTLLQGFFVVANIYGWIKWRRAGAGARDIAVERLSRRGIAWWLAGFATISTAWAWFTATYTDAARAWWDAPTLVASIGAQVLMGQRRLENWIVWIVVDFALIPLYVLQHLYGLAALYMVYLFLSVWGLIDWSRAYRTARAG